MAEEYPDKLKLYDHVSNSGIVHLPGRRFPAVAVQGDSLSTMLSAAIYLMKSAEHGDEDMYDKALDLAERLQDHLLHYEKVLEREGFEKPYNMDVRGLNLEQEFRKS